MRNRLDQIEEKFSALEKRKIWMLFFLVPLIMFGSFYYFYLDQKLITIKNKKNTIKSLDQMIEKNSPRTFLAKMQKEKKRILSNKAKLEKLKEQFLLLSTKIDENGYLLTNDRGLNTFLEDILNKSIKNNFTIYSLNIDDKNEKFLALIGQKKEISIVGSGAFADTLRFVREIEDAHILMGISDLNMELNSSKLTTSFKIKLFGVGK